MLVMNYPLRTVRSLALSVYKLRFMPRWAIIFMDIFLSFGGVIISFLLRFNFKTEKISSPLFVRGICITVAVYFICFLIFKTYKEVIRHTTFKGISRVFNSVVVANACIIFINLILANKKTVLIPNSVLLINLFISFCMLSANRIFIKKIFESGSNIKKEPVLIFGAGELGRIAAKAIVNNERSKWKIVGYADDDRLKTGKTLLGIPVYEIGKLHKIIGLHNVRQVIFAVNNIAIARRNELATFFIDCGVKVATLPPLEKWAHDPLKINEIKEFKIEELLEREPICINNIKIGTVLKNKNILITGAAGSIGSEIVRQITKFQPAAITLCDVAETPLHAMDLELKEMGREVNYKIFVCNITDERRME